MTNIRRGTPEDLLCIVEFQILLAAESEGVSLCRPTVESGVRLALSGQAGACYWLIETDIGEIQGVCMTVPEWSDWRNGIVLWIHSVYVAELSRGQGLFGQLYGHLRELVEKDQGLLGLRLYVDKRNRSAQAVYNAIGMNEDHYYLYEWMKG